MPEPKLAPSDLNNNQCFLWPRPRSLSHELRLFNGIKIGLQCSGLGWRFRLLWGLFLFNWPVWPLCFIDFIYSVFALFLPLQTGISKYLLMQCLGILRIAAFVLSHSLHVCTEWMYFAM